MAMFPGVALLTGAASGIGQATAVSFAQEGCTKIVIADRNASGLEDTERLIKQAVGNNKVEVLRLPTDVQHEDQVTRLIADAVHHFGRIDYAVNGAGILSNNEPSTASSVEAFDRINGVNYRGCWLCSRGELMQMLTQEPLPTHDGRPGSRGSIVNIASQLAMVGRPGAPAYCGSKAAVMSLTRCDAIDYSKDNIRINCVCPGVIDTPILQGNLEAIKPAIDIAPMRRAGTAQEVADCILFLASSKASFVQGSAMVVDGGYIIN